MSTEAITEISTLTKPESAPAPESEETEDLGFFQHIFKHHKFKVIVVILLLVAAAISIAIYFTSGSSDTTPTPTPTPTPTDTTLSDIDNMTDNELTTYIQSNLGTDWDLGIYIGTDNVANEVTIQTKIFLTGLTTYRDVFRKMSKTKTSDDSIVFVFNDILLKQFNSPIENRNKDPQNINQMTFWVVPENLRPADSYVGARWSLGLDHRSLF